MAATVTAGAAVTAAAVPQPVSAQVVGNAFVSQYYHILHHSPGLVHRFYQDISKLGRPEEDGTTSITTTMTAINEKVLSLNYGDFKAEIKSVDAQESLSLGVHVLVTGYMTGKDNVERNFAQSFFLAPQERGGYFVLNDMFRYVDKVSLPDIQSQVLPRDVDPPITTEHDIATGVTVKKAKTMATQSSSAVNPMADAFSGYADYLNQFNDKRERVVKASRDITINSKKVIFQVHRISKHNKEEVLEKANKDLAAVTDQHISKLVKELQGTDFWKLRRAYSPGIQEYVEAATFCNFCRTGSLLYLDEMNAALSPLSDPSVEPLQINVLDYLLGLADLTGELMRLAIGRVSDGELEFAEKICRFVQEIYREMTLLAPDMDDNSDIKMKMETMLQSVMKIENACFSVHVRGSEYIPLLGNTDHSYPMLMPDLA